MDSGIFGILTKIFKADSPTLNVKLQENGIIGGLSKVTTFEPDKHLNVQSILSEFKLNYLS